MAQLNAIIDKLLTGVSSMVKVEGTMAELLMPSIMVKQKTGKLAKYGHGHLRIERSITGGRGKYRRVEPIVRSNVGYSVESHGLEALVTEDDYANVELPYDAEADEVIGLQSHLIVEKEKVLADALANTATMTLNVTLSGTSQFSDYDNSDPISRFKTARAEVKEGCGLPPDTAWMSWEVWNVMRFHPQLLELFKYVKGGALDDSQLAEAFGVRRVLVGSAVYNSAKEGQTDDLAAIWGKHLWFGVIPQAAQVRQTSLGYTIGLSGRRSRRVYKYGVNNPPNSTGILCDDSYDFLLSNVNAAYLIKDAVA